MNSIIAKAKSMAKTAKTKLFTAKNAVTAWLTMALCTMNVYANTTIDTSYTINSGIATANIEGMIIGLAVWICRLVGIGMLIWGVYGYVTARKDGEAESMNGALGKLISGVVLIAMPAVLSALNIIN